MDKYCIMHISCLELFSFDKSIYNRDQSRPMLTYVLYNVYLKFTPFLDVTIYNKGQILTWEYKLGDICMYYNL